jgi:CMP-N,N'-diacetyllegionaminic acid synthase
MINNKKVLAIIPARGGSKGIPRKNIVPLRGKPLIAWTIEAARNSAFIDRVILSSEDAEICEVASQWGCDVPFVRPAELSADSTPGIDPVLHALTTLKESYDYVVLLQPTSPLRNSADIDTALEIACNGGHPACVSVVAVAKSPQWMFYLNDHGRLVAYKDSPQIALNRQEITPLFLLNGAVYVAEVVWLQRVKSFLSPETAAYVMPDNRSVDIDTPLDLCFCDFLMSALFNSANDHE